MPDAVDFTPKPLRNSLLLILEFDGGKTSTMIVNDRIICNNTIK